MAAVLLLVLMLPACMQRPRHSESHTCMQRITTKMVPSILTTPTNAYWRSIRKGVAPAFNGSNLRYNLQRLCTEHCPWRTRLSMWQHGYCNKMIFIHQHKHILSPTCGFSREQLQRVHDARSTAHRLMQLLCAFLDCCKLVRTDSARDYPGQLDSGAEGCRATAAHLLRVLSCCT